MKQDASEGADADNPFDYRLHDGTPVSAVTADDRVSRVARMGAVDCQRVLELPGVQKTVVAAARRRLREIERNSRRTA